MKILIALCLFAGAAQAEVVNGVYVPMSPEARAKCDAAAKRSGFERCIIIEDAEERKLRLEYEAREAKKQKRQIQV